MTTRQCDLCEGYGCEHCYGVGEEETDRTEVWNDTRGMITHNGKYLCGDCVEGTKHDTVYTVESVYFHKRDSWSTYRRANVNSSDDSQL